MPPRVRWRRAYTKIRIMLAFGADLELLFEQRRESKRLGLMVVRESLDAFLAGHLGDADDSALTYEASPLEREGRENKKK